MKIYFIRHGQQNSRLCNVDVDLSEIGRLQVKRLGKRLECIAFDKLYCSYLIRAKETANILSEYIHQKPEVDENLREIDFGELTGNTDEENKEKYSFFFEKQKKKQWDIPYPGGECAEDVFKRGSIVLQKMIESDCERICVVTHGGFIRAMITGLLGIDFSKQRMFGAVLENTSITEVAYDKETGLFSLERFNDYAHLEDDCKLLRGNWK